MFSIWSCPNIFVRWRVNTIQSSSICNIITFILRLEIFIVVLVFVSLFTQTLYLFFSSLGAPRSKPCLVNRARSASFENSSNDDADNSVSSVNSTPARSRSASRSNCSFKNFSVSSKIFLHLLQILLATLTET